MPGASSILGSCYRAAGAKRGRRARVCGGGSCGRTGAGAARGCGHTALSTALRRHGHPSLPLPSRPWQPRALVPRAAFHPEGGSRRAGELGSAASARDKHGRRHSWCSFRDCGTASKRVCDRQCCFILTGRNFTARITAMSNVRMREADFSSLENLGDKNASGSSALPASPSRKTGEACGVTPAVISWGCFSILSSSVCKMGELLHCTKNGRDRSCSFGSPPSPCRQARGENAPQLSWWPSSHRHWPGRRRAGSAEPGQGTHPPQHCF